MRNDLQRVLVCLSCATAGFMASAAAQDLALPLKENSVRFLIIGDSGTGDSAQRELANKMAAYHARFPFTFAIMLGDNLYGSERPQDYAKKFEIPYRALLDAKVEVYAALGNHDDPNQRFYKLFNLNGNRYRSFRKVNARFFVLDSNYMDPPQLEWLEKELQASGSDWKIAYFHHPLYTAASRGPNVELRAELEPLLVKYGVNVVFTGHEHVYERIKPQQGIQHFVAGGSAKLRRGDLTKSPQTEVGFDRDRTFMLVEIAGDELFFQTITRTGATIDRGVIRRSPQKTLKSKPRSLFSHPFFLPPPMSNPLLRVFSGFSAGRRAVESIVPRRTFDDVILPPATRRALDEALVHVTRHDLVFNHWGLAERHPTGLALAFNFAGPPGTGKTICAEAIAHRLGRRLLKVRYAEVESMWMGETPKNVRAVFDLAREQNAVLLFDEADAIASRRSVSIEFGSQREANLVVNVLLQELETFRGVVIFATNVAASFDPAFERRIRLHVLFEMPGVIEREQIWRVQMHPTRTPLAEDVDFRALAEKHAVSGGDIRNAVLKAALAAASEPGADAFKKVHQRHLESGMASVLDGKRVMRQSSLRPEDDAALVSDSTNPARMLAERLDRVVPLTVLAACSALVIAIVALLVALLR